MISLYTNKENCCGCSSCMNICPKNAIEMSFDEYGFIYPNINVDLCIDCNACIGVCDFQQIKIKSDKIPIGTYAGILKDECLLKSSSSGGAFVSLAKYTLDRNGIVFGCAMNDNVTPEHINIDKIDDIEKLQGSKYVQSKINKTFKEAQKYLNQGRTVLFTGTPCQIAGLKSYLKKDYYNLITVDLICHGVPSSTFFNGYIKWLEKKLKSRVIDVKFRDKTNGWGLLSRIYYERNNKISSKIIHPILSYYYNYFIKGDIYRESCYKCIYACSDRVGDFTIGDYWGIEKYHPEITKHNGVSLILANNNKAISIINGLESNSENSSKLKDYIDITESKFEYAKVFNEQLERPAIKTDRRDSILEMFKTEGFESVANKYYKDMRKQIVVFKIKSIIPQVIKKYIRKFI